MNKLNINKLWDHLHEIAEVSWEEQNTTDYLVDLFERNGFKPIRFDSFPGFYVDIGNGHPMVGLRADMDALLQEINGEMKANHSCGHDAHMSIVTGVMFQLKEMEAILKGTVRAIFQPAEEMGNGSISVVNTGIVDKLDYLFGLHLRPKNEIPFPDSAPGIQHGAAVFVKGEIDGTDHHGARPHEGVNAIEVGASILDHIQQIHVNPQIPSSLKMTNFHAGTDNLNIIPGKASFGLDMRAQTNEVIQEMKEKLDDKLKHLAELYKVKINYWYEDDVPAAIIHQNAERILKKVIGKVLGEEHVRETITISGSDDFHYYTLKKPHIQATMLALGADLTPGLHHPQMRFDKRALQNGIDILVAACLELLTNESDK